MHASTSTGSAVAYAVGLAIYGFTASEAYNQSYYFGQEKLNLLGEGPGKFCKIFDPNVINSGGGTELMLNFLVKYPYHMQIFLKRCTELLQTPYLETVVVIEVAVSFYRKA